MQNSSINDEIKKMSSEDALKKFSSDLKQGLSTEEAQKRLNENGPNALDEKKESMLKKFFQYFYGPIPFMIEIAAILSFVLKNWADFTIIMIMLIINGILGFIQEYKAGMQ